MAYVGHADQVEVSDAFTGAKRDSVFANVMLDSFSRGPS